MMKKGMGILLIGALAAMTLLGGCGKDETSASSVSSSAEDEGREVTAKELLEATDYDVTKYVTLMDGYMNLSVELESSYEVTDEDVQTYLDTNVLPYYPIYAESDRTVIEDGDKVNIDYEGTLDGEAFDGGTSAGYDLVIGSGSFIDGFEDGLIGVSVGESVDLDLTFPDDYSSEDLAGQAVVFHVTVNSLMAPETATLDTITDDYVNENFSGYGMTTVDELKDYFVDYLTSSNESSKQSEIQSNLLEQLEAGCTVEFPEGLLDERVEQIITSTKSAAEEDGTDYEEYLSSNYGYETEEDFREYASEQLSDQLVQELILEAIVADQGTSINTSDFDNFVAQYVSYYSYDSTEDFYEDYGGEDYLMLSYAESLAFQSVADGATVTEPEDTEDTDESADETTDEASDETSATEE